jgi:hypothetical protein
MTLSTKISLLLLLPALLFIASCTKKSELGELDPSSNVFAPENTHTNFFEVDSVKTDPYPYVQLYYHIRYDLIPDATAISKIIIYRNGTLVLRLSPTQVNAFYPRDLGVDRYNTYSYTFAFEEADGSLSRFTDPFYVHVP